MLHFGRHVNGLAQCLDFLDTRPWHQGSKTVRFRSHSQCKPAFGGVPAEVPRGLKLDPNPFPMWRSPTLPVVSFVGAPQLAESGSLSASRLFLAKGLRWRFRTSLEGDVSGAWNGTQRCGVLRFCAPHLFLREEAYSALCCVFMDHGSNQMATFPLVTDLRGACPWKHGWRKESPGGGWAPGGLWLGCTHAWN